MDPLTALASSSLVNRRWRMIMPSSYSHSQTRPESAKPPPDVAVAGAADDNHRAVVYRVQLVDAQAVDTLPSQLEDLDHSVTPLNRFPKRHRHLKTSVRVDEAANSRLVLAFDRVEDRPRQIARIVLRSDSLTPCLSVPRADWCASTTAEPS